MLDAASRRSGVDRAPCAGDGRRGGAGTLREKSPSIVMRARRSFTRLPRGSVGLREAGAFATREDVDETPNS